jgi:hypothetical protein
MKLFKPLQSARVAGSLALALALISSATTVRANVYATDIQINGSLSSITNASGSTVNITYILNEPATAGVTVNILQGNAVVDTIAGGTNMGLNSVSWGGTNSAGNLVSNGTYSVSITAGAVGYPIWTQTSLDSSNNVAVHPEGIAVDNNTNSPYYGRVMVGCAVSGTENGVTQQCGIYKMNADGSPADEGSFGYGGYTTDDNGDNATGEMPSSGGYDPWRLRIGDDDRLYMEDWSVYGAIVAFDMQVTTNQIVINESGYADNPYYENEEFRYGLGNFDILFTATTNATVWLCSADPITFGVWYWHMTNGAAATNDTVGTWAVEEGPTSDLPYYQKGPTPSSGVGCMVDANLDFFISQYHYDANPPYYTAMLYTNWDEGSLWPGNRTTNEYGQQTNQVRWGVGTNDPAFEGVQDTVINNRQHPTMAALPMLGGNDGYPGIRVLNAADGSVVTVTNGAEVQTLTNIDYPNQYTCAAWDNVGNLYGASSSAYFWRVWSPPGTNQATTVAVPQLIVGAPLTITGITNSPTTPGCSAVAITFTAPGYPLPSAFTLISSDTVNGTYTAVAASITGGLGVYQAAVTNCSTAFYRIKWIVEEPFAITGITASPTTPGCSAVTITFTAPGNPLLSAFKLVGSPTVNGTYAAVTASITGGSGVYQAAVTNCSTVFYQIMEYME